ncbi:MAG: response regulator [bacterium]|nr:response regulator [bacterium]
MSCARRVLVIDDETVVRNSCRRVLEEEGFHVSVAADGREGIEKLSKENFDAVIVDLRMPGVGGMDVLRIVKRNKPDARVLIITAYSSVASAVEAMQLGAADYLPKPFTPKELAEKVNRVLQRAEPPAEPRTKKARFSHKRRPVPEVEEVTEGVLAEARILLAGSHADEMEALRQCLSSEPWQVRTVERHGEIIEMIRAGQADVLITGVDVLGMKAYDLIPEVKKLGSDIPIIVACADPSLDLARKIREFGIFFYLMEPFDPEEVRGAVRDAVKRVAMLRREIEAPHRKSTLVRSVRTVAKNGTKVDFVAIGELVDENSSLYREIVGELKRRVLPMRMELAHKALTAKELPWYLEQDDRVIIVAAFEANAGFGEVVTYSAEGFERLATKEQQRKLRELAYPEVLYWLKAQGIAPEVKIVSLPAAGLTAEQARRAASIIVGEGLS